ncbi:MAG: LiaI-LiaF-like domain-containing protein [Candidatus Acidiferrales bacterium]
MIDGHDRRGGLFIGILITVLGVIFLLDQLEIVHAAYVFQVFWPVILIAFGASILARTTYPGNATAGTDVQRYRTHTGNFWGPVLIVIGGLWLLSNITHYDMGRLWPLWMIAVGVWLLINREHYDEVRRARRHASAIRDWWDREGRYGAGTPPPPDARPPGAPGPAPGVGSGPTATSSGFANQEWNPNPQATPNAPPPGSPSGGPGVGPSASFVGPGFSPAADSVDDTFERSVVFMSFNRRIMSRHFRFGKVSAVFGGFHLDFRAAEIEGNQAVLQIEAVFGGGEILVPPTWRVSVTAHEIAGAFADETYSRPDATAPAKVLVIHGTTVFGGVVIKN